MDIENMLNDFEDEVEEYGKENVERRIKLLKDLIKEMGFSFSD